MSEIVIVDTSVLLNVFNVPSFNQNRESTLSEFEALVDDNVSFLIPMAAVFETGDHIADLSDGSQRRRYAEMFRAEIQSALRGERPWFPIRFPATGELAEWLTAFPEYAMRGPDLSDLSIIKAWEEACDLHPARRVRIWSLDTHLQSYDRET